MAEAPNATQHRIPPSGDHRGTQADNPLDKRIHAYSADVADIALEGHVDAKRFERPVPHRLVEGVSEMMRAAPDATAVCVSELLPGQRFDVVDDAEGWAWGFSAHDHYVGYVRSEHLRADAPTRTHRIVAPLALCFHRPDIKSEVAMTLPLNAEIAAETFDETFLRHRNGTFVHYRHAGAIEDFADDWVEVAEFFLGSPYRWGGRQRAGIDCSGLVQTALAACGHFVARDSDQQAASIGRDVRGGTLQRGDFVFFPSHVGIMADSERLLHANAHWMTTLVEPLSDVVGRLDLPDAEAITAVRRL